MPSVQPMLTRPKFPGAGIRVLVLEYNRLRLQAAVHMLKLCSYQVTACDRETVALEILCKKNGEFDIVLTNLHLPDMDGPKFLDHVVLGMNLPVIVMLDGCCHTRDDIVQSFTHGACDVIFTPLSMPILSVMWLRVAQKQVKDFENFRRMQQIDLKRKRNSGGPNSSSLTSRTLKNPEASTSGTEYSGPAVMKKPRVVWSSRNLHERFVAAVNQLGIENAAAKEVLDLMNEPGLNREQVSSHLQKYLGKLGRAGKKENSSGAYQQSGSTRREIVTGNLRTNDTAGTSHAHADSFQIHGNLMPLAITRVAATTGSKEVIDNAATSMEQFAASTGSKEVVDNAATSINHVAATTGSKEDIVDNATRSMDQVAATMGSKEVVDNAATSMNGATDVSTCTDKEVTEDASSELDDSLWLEQCWSAHFDFSDDLFA